MTSKIFLRTAATLAFSSLAISLINASPAKSDEYRGRVEKDGNKRIARPLNAHLDSVTAAGGIRNAQGAALGAASDFLLRTTANRESTDHLKSSTSQWNPWVEDGSLSLGASHSLIATPVNATHPLQSAVDYTAIEHAYANAVPPISAALNGGNQQITANGLDTLAAQAALNRYAALNGNRIIGNQPIVDVDNCACETPVPSSQCIQTRQVGIYANGRGPTMTTNPSLGNVLNGTAIPGGNAAAAIQHASGGSISSGGFHAGSFGGGGHR